MRPDPKNIFTFLFGLIKESLPLYWMLIKVMVPIMIIVRVAQQLGVVTWVSQLFAPIMSIVGLPGEMGLVWASAMMMNIYGGAAALVALLPTTPLTEAQATVLGTMILIAHALPMEQRFAQLAGPSVIFTTALRIGGAIVFGFILHLLYNGLDMLQTPVAIDWLPSTSQNASWWQWALNSGQSLLTIYCILLALLTLLRVMDKIGLTQWLTNIMSPMLRGIGISKQAGPMTMVGLLLGLSYGGALIVREAKAGTLSARDIFLAICFLCLCHSLIEDTLFIIALGGHVSGVLLVRFVLSVAIVGLLAIIVHKMPDRIFYKYLFRQPDTEKKTPTYQAAE